ARVARLLGDAPGLSSEGRAFPVATRHLGREPGRRLEDAGTDAILPPPGQATDFAPLYGARERAEQDRAIAPSPAGRRKIVLATSIAETSLTIEGVRVVVDSGASRVPRFDPSSGLTRLATVRVSRAAADQRRGRAGRTEPGVCWRLWDEAGTRPLPAFERRELLEAALSGLALDLARWGARDAASLALLDPPPAAAFAEARA